MVELPLYLYMKQILLRWPYILAFSSENALFIIIFALCKVLRKRMI